MEWKSNLRDDRMNKVSCSSKNPVSSAYTTWLHDISAASPNRKKKKNRRLSCGLSLPSINRMRPASKYIEDERTLLETDRSLESNRSGYSTGTSRTNKSSNNEKDTPSASKERRFIALSKEISFSHIRLDAYSKDLRPGNHFFRWLNVPLDVEDFRIPPTLVISNSNQKPFIWISTEKKKQKYKEFSTMQDAYRHGRKLFQRLAMKVDGESNPVAVLKSPQDRKYYSNHIDLINSQQQLQQTIIDLFAQTKDSPSCTERIHVIQGFVLSKGRNAWMVRVRWTRKSINAWVISDLCRPTTDSTSVDTCSIIRSTESSWKRPKDMVDMLVKGISQKYDFNFEEFIADYMQDGQGRWYFIQVKAFKGKQLKMKDSVHEVISRKGTEPEKKCEGKFCHVAYDINNEDGSGRVEILDSSEGGFLSRKDLLEGCFTHRFETGSLLEDGSMAYFSTDSFSRSLEIYLSQLSKRDRNRFYDRVKVCFSCFHEYKRLKKLRTTLVFDEQQREKEVLKVLSDSKSKSSFSKKKRSGKLAPIHAPSSLTNNSMDPNNQPTTRLESDAPYENVTNINPIEVVEQFNTPRKQIESGDTSNVVEDIQSSQMDADNRGLMNSTSEPPDIESEKGRVVSNTEMYKEGSREGEETIPICSSTDKVQYTYEKSLEPLGEPVVDEVIPSTVIEEQCGDQFSKVEGDNLPEIVALKLEVQPEESLQAEDNQSTRREGRQSPREGLKSSEWKSKLQLKLQASIQASINHSNDSLYPPMVPGLETDTTPYQSIPAVENEVTAKPKEQRLSEIDSQLLPVHVLTMTSCEKFFYSDTYKDEIMCEIQQQLQFLHRVRVQIPLEDGVLDVSAKRMILRTLHMESREACRRHNEQYSLPSITHCDENDALFVELIPKRANSSTTGLIDQVNKTE